MNLHRRCVNSPYTWRIQTCHRGIQLFLTFWLSTCYFQWCKCEWVCVGNIFPRGESLYTNTWLTWYWFISPNPKTNCQYNCLMNGKPGSDPVVMNVFREENGGRRKSHFGAADESTVPLKIAVHRELKFTTKNNYLNIFQRWEELSQRLGWALQRARAAGSGYNWAEIGLPWQWYFVQSNALQWLDDQLSHSFSWKEVEKRPIY